MAVSRDFAADNAGEQGPHVQFKDVFDLQHSDRTIPPEQFMEDAVSMITPKSRAMSHHLQSTKIPSRRALKIRAKIWRNLMALGMYFHDYSPPKAPKPSFRRKIVTNTTPIELLFYLPAVYHDALRKDPSHRFPIVVNFHGGGFVLGDATDDRYWARVVTTKAPVVFVSVNYRRAPEHPFPVPVDDCVEALLFLSSHAHELHLDPMRIAMSGFSAGANLAFSVPLRLKYHHQYISQPSNLGPTDSRSQYHHNLEQTPSRLTPATTNQSMSGDNSTANSPSQSTSHLLGPTNTPLNIVSIIAWYPLLDWTESRSAKKRSSRNPDKCLPKTFTDLFDFSYIPAPDHAGNHCSPFASPGLAPDHMLQEGIPHDIQLWLCEWDMLLGEGQKFAERLEKAQKNLYHKIIPQVPHGFDKSPNPWRNQKAIDALYERSVKGLMDVFEGRTKPGIVPDAGTPIRPVFDRGETEAVLKKVGSPPRKGTIIPSMPL